MSYPYGRPGGQSGSGDPRGVGASGGQCGVRLVLLTLR